MLLGLKNFLKGDGLQVLNSALSCPLRLSPYMEDGKNTHGPFMLLFPPCPFGSCSGRVMDETGEQASGCRSDFDRLKGQN